MITNRAIIDEEQQRVETNSIEAGTSLQDLQVAVPFANSNVVQVRLPSSSDGSRSTSEDEDDAGRQVAVVAGPSTEAANKIVNTFTDCTNVTSSVHNTNIYEDGVTINKNFYCCPASLDYVLECSAPKRRITIFVASLLSLALIIFLGWWLANSSTVEQSNYAETETTQIMVSTTEKLPSITVSMASSVSTDPTTSNSALPTSTTESSVASSTEIVIHEWKIIKRSDWGAEPPNFWTEKLAHLPPRYVIFSETETDACATTQRCTEIVREIQASHLSGGLQADIKYNFLIGGDGMVYEGRGWDLHAGVGDYDIEDYDHNSIGVSFIGKFNDNAPTAMVFYTAKMFLQFGSRMDKLEESPKLKGLRQLKLNHSIRNPGDKLYSIIKTWEGWDP